MQIQSYWTSKSKVGLKIIKTVLTKQSRRLTWLIKVKTKKRLLGYSKVYALPQGKYSAKLDRIGKLHTLHNGLLIIMQGVISLSAAHARFKPAA